MLAFAIRRMSQPPETPVRQAPHGISNHQREHWTQLRDRPQGDGRGSAPQLRQHGVELVMQAMIVELIET